MRSCRGQEVLVLIALLNFASYHPATCAAAAMAFKIVSVSKAATIKELCEANGLPYSTGCGYYKLERKEKVSAGKDLVAHKPGRQTKFVCGSTEAPLPCNSLEFS